MVIFTQIKDPPRIVQEEVERRRLPDKRRRREIPVRCPLPPAANGESMITASESRTAAVLPKYAHSVTLYFSELVRIDFTCINNATAR
ncbi:Uncharacterized protein DAT39_010875 [Clarias magur]|uniref:Uncharacterized protein n=1 Tax=Clarias magur TaxID=1594786 RepID=A0A8J4UKF9_CLAMG|nr:Uncharacterized protein DAT39_010875 [Clarias magur]